MIIEIDNISFSFGKRKVLDNICFSIDRPGVTVLLGPNGSGKTTLLRCISRIINPGQGEIYADGKRFSSFSSEETAHLLSYVAQSGVSGKLTVFDAVLLGRLPHMCSSTGEKDIEIVSSILKRLNLEKISFRYIDEISGGELQKVSIARALVQKAPLMILDEPTSALDLKNQIEILRLLKEISETDDVMVLLSMHDLNTAFRFADNFIFMKEGRIIADLCREEISCDVIEDVYDVPVELDYYRNCPVVNPAE